MEVGGHKGEGESHVLMKNLCVTDHIIPLLGNDTPLSDCLYPRVAENSAKQWGLLTLGPSKSIHLAGFFGLWFLEPLKAKALQLSSGFQAPTVLPRTGYLLFLSPLLPAKSPFSP